MANRYLRATGNWNGPVWAATSGGAAGSAATPTDDDDVYLMGTLVVTLVADADCKSISLTPGPPPPDHGPRVEIGVHNLHVYGDVVFYGQISGSGSVTVGGDFNVESLTPAYPGLITINTTGNTSFVTNSNTYEDVRINMSGANETLTITGSPTFRSLIIQSKNSAAHTVKIDDGATLEVDKFVAIGSSPSNRLAIDVQSGVSGLNSGFIKFRDGGTCYGQNVAMKFIFASVSGTGFKNPYIGSNSTTDFTAGALPWLLQDPPKISTLVDPLTTAPGSNSNWTVDTVSSGNATVSPTNTGSGGGGYTFRFENR